MVTLRSDDPPALDVNPPASNCSKPQLGSQLLEPRAARR